MEKIILIALLIIAGSVITGFFSYLYSKRKSERKIDEYMSLNQALKQVNEKLNLANNEFLSVDGKLKLSSENLLKLKSETAELIDLKRNEKVLNYNLFIKKQELSAIQSQIDKHLVELSNNKKALNEIMGELDLYSRIEEYVSYGYFEMPQYLYNTSEKFSKNIQYVREKQKDMIKNQLVVTYPSSTEISNNKSLNKKILEGQVKLMITAFNIECDFIIGKVAPSSFSRTLERIEKLANDIEKSAATLRCGFNIDYIQLKFEECTLQYQFSLKKQEEVIEQKLIKEQIREEQRAIKEYEKAIAEAEKEENMYRKLLEKAREELLKASEKDKLVMELRIVQLEKELQEAQLKEDRAKSMAEQTRKGHVYVISNIGSFGENIYKIGLTRRLDPMDRVKELGNASVPFPFDVHAMIYSNDAPALEAALHREFYNYRVNSVNLRKEFFQVDLDAIRDAVNRIAGIEAEFIITALAKDYYESLRLQNAA